MNNCGLANSTVQANEWIHYITEQLIVPSYLVIGTACNALLLIAFYKQSKLEKPYVYQVLLTASKMLEVITLGVFLLGHYWFSGYYIKGAADWFQKSYVIVFINYKLGTGLHMHFIVSSVLLATAMAADRAFCLIDPMRYKNIDHKLHQFVAGLVCFTLPAVTSISYGWFWKILPEQDRYIIVANIDFIDSFIGRFCSEAGQGVRLISLATLIIVNVINVRAFGKRSKTLAKLGQERLAAESKAAEKTLMVLSVSQSVLMCVNQIPHVALYVMLDIAPNYTVCHSTIFAPLAHLFIFLTDMVDVVVVLIVNKKMRRMVKRVIGCGCWQVGVAATPVANAGAAKAQAVMLGALNRNNAVHG